MFYDNDKLGIIIKGIFSVTLQQRTAYETERKHSALAYRIDGSSKFYSNGRELSVESGSIIYIPAGVDYQRVTENDEHLITLHLDTFGKNETEIQAVPDCEDLRHLFETLCKFWERNEYNKCIRTVYKIFDELKLLSPDLKATVPDSIASGVDYLYNNYRSHEISISELARRCHVSETYFRKVYGAHFGESPVKTLLDLRFNYAKSLLESGYYQIKEVASLSGFADTKYFRTAFKKRFGITPNGYCEKYSDN